MVEKLFSKFLEPNFTLFGKTLAPVPPSPVLDDGIKFDGTKWILAPFGGGGENNTSSNVGLGAGWALAKVGVDLPFKSIIVLPPLLITVNPNDITISLTGGIPPSYVLMCYGREVTNGIDFMCLTGGKFDENPTESERENIMPNAGTFKRMTFFIFEQKNAIQTITLRKNGADANQSLTIPASTTGTFQDLVNTDSFVSGDKFSYKLDISGAGTFSVSNSAMEIEA